MLTDLRSSLKCLYLAGNPATADMAAVQVGSLAVKLRDATSADELLALRRMYRTAYIAGRTLCDTLSDAHMAIPSCWVGHGRLTALHGLAAGRLAAARLRQARAAG